MKKKWKLALVIFGPGVMMFFVPVLVFASAPPPDNNPNPTQSFLLKLSEGVAWGCVPLFVATLGNCLPVLLFRKTIWNLHGLYFTGVTYTVWFSQCVAFLLFSGFLPWLGPLFSIIPIFLFCATDALVVLLLTAALIPPGGIGKTPDAENEKTPELSHL